MVYLSPRTGSNEPPPVPTASISVMCRSGNHYRIHRVFGPEGCQYGHRKYGASCLCECHDEKEG